MSAAPSRPPAVARRHVALALEMIGEDRRQLARRVAAEGRRLSLMQQRHTPPRPFVARVTGVKQTGGFRTERLRGMRSYRNANGAGSRGIYEHYVLEEGQVYEVLELRTWSRSSHYYATVRAGELVHLTPAEMAAWGW